MGKNFFVYKLYKSSSKYPYHNKSFNYFVRNSLNIEFNKYYNFEFQFEWYKELTLFEFTNIFDNIKPDNFFKSLVVGDIIIKKNDSIEEILFCDKIDFKICNRIII